MMSNALAPRDHTLSLVRVTLTQRERDGMKTFRRSAAVMVLQAFLAPSESFAAETSGMTLPIASDMSIVSTVESAEFVDPALGVETTLDQAEA